MKLLELAPVNSDKQSATLRKIKVFSRQIYIYKEQANQKRLANFSHVCFGELDIYYHDLNDVHFYEEDNFKCIVIGKIFHPDQLSFDFSALLNSGAINSFCDANKALEHCVGRFYFIYSGVDGDFLRADPTSLAQINFHCSEKIIATDLNLVKEISGELSLNQQAHDFYVHTFPSKGNGNAWVGNESIYTDVNKILPNFALDLVEFKEVRYWPWEPYCENEFSKSVALLAKELKKTLNVLSHESPLSIAVTGGNDSRVMLAASKDIRDKCYYFIDKLPSMSLDHTDISIGRQLCDIFGVKYNIHDSLLDVNEIPVDFKNEYLNSVFFAMEKRLPEVYYYSCDLSHYINICGVGEFGRSVYGTPASSKSTGFLCNKYLCGNSNYGILQTKKWRDDFVNSELTRKYPMNTLYYIEQKLGNWGAVGNAESDIAFEEVNPFASHFNISLMIKLNKKYTTYNNCELYASLIDELAPELNSLPINPAKDVKSKFVKKIKSSIFITLIDEMRAIYSVSLSKKGH
ncbi:hypothetical protein ACUALS_15395 [Vibrio sp. NH-7]